METQNYIYVLGTITKQETVSTINDKILPGSLVFEALAPFPGYYNEATDAGKPIYMYMALHEQYPLIDIIRATEKVENVFHETFDAGLGLIKIHTDTYTVLRVRHLKYYDLIGKLQEIYQSQGLLFLQKSKKGLQEEAQIKVVKFFSLLPVSEGIYLDKNEEFHSYLEMPRHFNWDEFNDLTNTVKYNWEESKFDAAVGAFYHNRKLHEFVRIYSDQLHHEYLGKLRNLYLEKIR